MKDKILNKLQSQKLEIVTLITMQAIAVKSIPDNGSLNNLQRAFQLNEEIIKLIKDDSKV